MARGLKFRIYEVEGLYYLCSENLNADQLHCNRAFVFAYAKSRFSHEAAHIEEATGKGIKHDFPFINIGKVPREELKTKVSCTPDEKIQVNPRFKPGPEVIKLFSCSTQLSMKFILLINVKNSQK